MILENETWTRVRDSDLSSKVALLPTGSTEQHGPHAPLCTDSLIASEVAGETASRTDAVSLPPVTVGVSEEHRGFDGTLHVSPDTFRSYVSDILTSLSCHGCERAVLVNGHGGNIDALDEVCAETTRSGDMFATTWTWWNAVDDPDFDMGHAGPLETSLVLHLEPELVDDDSVEGGAESWGEYVECSPVSYDTDDFTQNGVVGDPTRASAEKGEELFEDAVSSLSRLVEWVDENR
ncbi:MAG: creatininase family protein [Halobacteria archaeon]|nr:creatininase family protein [Halobacteria archaeon]